MLVNIQKVMRIIIRNQSKSEGCSWMLKMMMDCGKSGVYLKKLLKELKMDYGKQHDTHEFLLGFLNLIRRQLPDDQLDEWNTVTRSSFETQSFCIMCGSRNNIQTTSSMILQVK